MKQIIYVIIFISCFITTVKAQEFQMKDLTTEEKAEFLTEALTDGIELTDEQQAEAYSINYWAVQELSKISTIKNEMDKFKTFRSIELRKQHDFKKLLSRKQYKKFKKNNKELFKTLIQAVKTIKQNDNENN